MWDCGEKDIASRVHKAAMGTEAAPMSKLVSVVARKILVEGVGICV